MSDLGDPFRNMSDEELQQYAKDWGIEGRKEISRDDLIKALNSRQGTTGTAPESSLPLEHRGPSQPGHQRGETPT